MGDDNVELLEQTVKHNAEDIKEVRLDLKELSKEFDQFKMKHTVVESNVNQIFTMLSKVEEKMGALEGKWDQAKDDQNKELKGFILKIAAAIIIAVVIAGLSIN